MSNIPIMCKEYYMEIVADFLKRKHEWSYRGNYSGNSRIEGEDVHRTDERFGKSRRAGIVLPHVFIIRIFNPIFIHY